MKNIFQTAAWVLIFTWMAEGGERVVYVTTLATSHTHVGQNHTLSGLFYQTPGDSTWGFMARPNNRVYSMDAYLPSGGRILAMATHTGVQQSWDGGKPWKPTSDWRMTEVSVIRFAADNPRKLYAASPYGFYKTTDDGCTWTAHNNGLDNPDAPFVTALVIDDSRPGRLLISTEAGLYESDDDGEHWHAGTLEVNHVRTLVQHPRNPEVWLAGTEDHGLYRSVNHGKNWQKCDSGILHATFYSIAFDPSHPDTLYAGGFQTGVYKSSDGGKTWKQFFSGLTSLDVHSLAVDPADSRCVYAGSTAQGVFLSQDGGLTWRNHGIAGGYVWTIKILNYER